MSTTVTLVDHEELVRVVEQAVGRALAAQERSGAWNSVEEAAEHLGLTEASLRSMRQRGEGPKATTFPNGRVRYSITDLDAWARSAC
jgi:Helix-turn-helix domain